MNDICPCDYCGAEATGFDGEAHTCGGPKCIPAQDPPPDPRKEWLRDRFADEVYAAKLEDMEDMEDVEDVEDEEDE